MLRKNTYSKSLRDFERSLRRASKLREMESRRYKDPPPPRQTIAVEALRGGAVVLMVAAFERYVKDAFEEYADEVARRAKSTGHPKLEKEFSECNDYNFVHCLIRESREKKVQKIVELSRIAKLIAVNGFIPEAFSRTRANPGPETLKELFKDFGVTDVFRVIEDNLKNHYPAPFASGFARSQLDAIIGWRNDVAHGGGALNMARADLERWVVFMGALGRAVDNTLRDRTLAVVAVL